MTAMELKLGSHQRNFADFYEDELVARGYDWKQLIEYYLYQGEDSLASQLISGCEYTGLPTTNSS
jgi:hypothetical protein